MRNLHQLCPVGNTTLRYRDKKADAAVSCPKLPNLLIWNAPLLLMSFWDLKKIPKLPITKVICAANY